jgi:tetratricopeptide (TPR) repeat protein
MNRSDLQLVPLFLFLLLFGCNERTNKTVSVGEPSSPAARAKAYILLGKASSVINIDSGFFYYHKAMTVIDSFDLADEKGKVLYNLGMLNRSAGNYRNFIMLIDSALRFSRSVNDFATMSNSLNALGSFYNNLGEKVVARKKFDSAFAIAKHNSLYLQMGSAFGNLAKFEADGKKSIMQSRQAIAYLAGCPGREEPVASILINIGSRVPDPDSAIYYYSQAINMVNAEKAPEVIIGAYNNMAYCYLWKGDLANAERCIMEHALPVALKTNNVDWQATIYDTYADVLQRKGNPARAMVYKKKSVEARKRYRESVAACL